MSFSLSLSKAIKKRKGAGEKAVRGTLIGLSGRIIKATPVGNPELWLYYDKSKQQYVDYISALGYPAGYVGGTLRGAWNASINSPDESVSNDIDGAGGETIQRATGKINRVKIGDTFYLTNPQPYALRVEFGWSTQAPTGMVRNAVNDLKSAIGDT